MRIKKGFTLIELLVVVGLIALLAGLLSFSLFNTVNKAKSSALHESISNALTLVNTYASMQGIFVDSDGKVEIIFPLDSAECQFRITNKQGVRQLSGDLPIPNKAFEDAFNNILEVKDDPDLCALFTENTVFGIQLSNIEVLTPDVMANWVSERDKISIAITELANSDNTGKTILIKNAKIEKK